MKLRRTSDGREFEVEVLSYERGSVRARIDGREVDAIMQPLPDGSSILSVGGRRVRVFGARRGSSILVAAGPLAFELNAVEGRSLRAAHGLASPEVVAPMPGKVLKLFVKEGDQIEAGQPLITIEAMKMETTLTAETPAIVKNVLVAEGDMIDHGQVMIELSPVHDSSPPRSAPSAP